MLVNLQQTYNGISAADIQNIVNGRVNALTQQYEAKEAQVQAALNGKLIQNLGAV